MAQNSVKKPSTQMMVLKGHSHYLQLNNVGIKKLHRHKGPLNQAVKGLVPQA
jgi:hypothetical protein